MAFSKVLAMLVLDFIAIGQKYSRFYICVTDGLILGYLDLSVNAMLIPKQISYNLDFTLLGDSSAIMAPAKTPK